ncbi:MAG: hypothetical protein AUG09_02705 [Acidobacteria bacterium 13_1_20CM_2_68_7]|nr:MAG: hypothetical protein AUG09_02705 [Acidobacteria bacterium 13_1_20CM_2_68_7]
MSDAMRAFGTVSGALAFLLCFLGGAWILTHVDLKSKDDAIWVGMGLYFIGKAFFVGPMLVIASRATAVAGSRENKTRFT